MDAMSPKLLARIAAQLGLFYDEILSMCASAPLQGHVTASWADILGRNLRLYRGLAHYHDAATHADEYQYGVQVARLSAAVDLLRAASESPPPAMDAAMARGYRDAYAKVHLAYTQAEKDNSTIYLETVPPLSALPMLTGRAVVKAVNLHQLSAPLTANEDPFVQVGV